MCALGLKLILGWLLWCRLLSATPVTSDLPTEADRRLVQWIRSPDFLQMEFFTMASGSYLAFPAASREPHEERQFAKISSCASQLWTQLSCMRQMDQTIEAVTHEVSSVLKDLIHYRNAVNFVCQKIDANLTEDSHLGPKYAHLKNLSTVGPPERVYFWRSLDDVVTLPADKMASWLGDRQIRRLLLNGDFLRYAKPRSNGTENGTDDRLWWTSAQVLLTMSQDSQLTDHVQTLYDQVLTETANELNSNLDFRQPTALLFERLIAKFKTDASLGGQFERLMAEEKAAVV